MPFRVRSSCLLNNRSLNTPFAFYSISSIYHIRKYAIFDKKYTIGNFLSYFIDFDCIGYILNSPDAFRTLRKLLAQSSQHNLSRCVRHQTDFAANKKLNQTQVSENLSGKYQADIKAPLLCALPGIRRKYEHHSKASACHPRRHRWPE